MTFSIFTVEKNFLYIAGGQVFVMLYLIAFLLDITAPVGIWEMDMTPSVLHHSFNVVTPLAYDV